MYHENVIFWTAGIRSDYVEEWKKCSPLPRFTHEFRELSDLSQISMPGHSVVIFHTSSPFSPGVLRKALGDSGTYCVYRPGMKAEETA